MISPRISVIVPTHQNRAVLERCLASFERFAADQPLELCVIEDGCADGTAEALARAAESVWGREHLRFFHEPDVNQLHCDNRGFREARGDLFLVWDDDMFLEVSWLVPELIATMDAYPEIGLMSLICGQNMSPLAFPITEFEHLHDPRHMTTTMGEPPLNWLRITEVDSVIKPWVVRRALIEKVGPLDPAFAPMEWDETDLCYRIRRAGFAVATHNWQRLGAFVHLGSSTLQKKNYDKHKAMVLPHGQLFRARWEETIKAEHARARRTWWRRMPAASVIPMMRKSIGRLVSRAEATP